MASSPPTSIPALKNALPISQVSLTLFEVFEDHGTIAFASVAYPTITTVCCPSNRISTRTRSQSTQLLRDEARFVSDLNVRNPGWWQRTMRGSSLRCWQYRNCKRSDRAAGRSAAGAPRRARKSTSLASAAFGRKPPIGTCAHALRAIHVQLKTLKTAQAANSGTSHDRPGVVEARACEKKVWHDGLKWHCCWLVIVHRRSGRRLRMVL